MDEVSQTPPPPEYQGLSRSTADKLIDRILNKPAD